MLVPKSYPKTFGTHSQQLFSSTESRSGSRGPPQTGAVQAHRQQTQQLCESCCLRESIWEIQTFPVEIPSAQADFPSFRRQRCHQGQCQTLSFCGLWSPLLLSVPLWTLCIRRFCISNSVPSILRCLVLLNKLLPLEQLVQRCGG